MENSSISTVAKWIHRLGHSYEHRKRSYHADDHEKEENVAHRKQLMKIHMSYESRTFKWTKKMPSERQDLIESEELDLTLGCRCWVDSYEMWEFNVDDCRKLSEKSKEAKFRC